MALILRTLFVLVLAAAFVGGGLRGEYRRFQDAPVSIGEEPLVFEVPKGSTLRQVGDGLAERGVISHPYYLMVLALQRGDQGKLKAGEFELTPGMRPADVLDRLVSGKTIQYPVTLVEGWTFRQAVDAIAALRPYSDLKGKSDADLMVALGKPGEHPEGRLFPDTYAFPRGATGLDVLRRAYERMEQILAEEWEGRASGLPVDTPYEALILASIIEKETGLAEERPAIAGVFVRRLEKGMRLQTDPTVIYGMGERFDGDIRRADLREATPYNTYVIDGLPPTPIALPGRAAIHAALNPESGDSLYFVARGDGGHVFSVTLDEHNAAVRRYQLARPAKTDGQ
jgi:UPF0755 protein